MKRILLVSLIAIVACGGCQQDPSDDGAVSSEPAVGRGTPAPGAGPAGAGAGGKGIAANESRGDDIGIISPAAGSLSPVTGGENLQGSGGSGGVGAAAKNLAKDTASKASQAPAEPPSDDSGY